MERRETIDTLIAGLSKLRLRLTLQQWGRFNARALLITAIACCGWVVAVRLFPALGAPLMVPAGAVAAGVALATFFAFYRRPGLAEAAVMADLRLDLKERLISSYQLADAQGPMIAALHHDARARLAQVSLTQAFPFPITRTMKWLAVPVLAFGLLYAYFPELDLLRHREKEAIKLAKEMDTKAKVEKLRTIAKTLKPPDAQKSPELGAAAAEIERIARDLEAGAITDKQALARLSDLEKELESLNEKMKSASRNPMEDGDVSKLGMGKDIASDLAKGDLKAAAEKLKGLKEKMEKGELSDEQKKSLAKDMEEISKMMSGKEGTSELGESLSKQLSDLSQSLSQGDLAQAMKDMEAAKMSMEDLASAMEQMQAMNEAKEGIEEMKKKMGCASCNLAGKDGKDGRETGWGMKGEGKGMGNEVGELPDDPDVGYKPSVLPGPMTKDKALMSIIEKGSPDEGAETKLEYVDSAFDEVKMEAEDAMAKEEIPAGSKEFVRQYFGELEPEKQNESQ